MPIYEYACNNCDHRLDALQKVSDEPLKDCPECGEPALRKLLSAPRFRLKGKGWYETDFKNDNRRNLSTGDDSPPKTDGKKDETTVKSESGSKSTTEAKKEAKADAKTAKDKTASGSGG